MAAGSPMLGTFLNSALCVSSYLDDCNLHPFPLIHDNHEYKSFQWVLSPSSELSKFRVDSEIHKLAVGTKNEGSLLDCAPSKSETANKGIAEYI